jgi:hypothetical protein
MKKEKIYIAGKVTGDPRYKEKFEACAKHLEEELGWKRENIVNPAQEVPEGTPWLKAMWKCLKLLKGCGWVAMLPDWRESRGARIEHWYAQFKQRWIMYIGTTAAPENEKQ